MRCTLIFLAASLFVLVSCADSPSPDAGGADVADALVSDLGDTSIDDTSAPDAQVDGDADADRADDASDAERVEDTDTDLEDADATFDADTDLEDANAGDADVADAQGADAPNADAAPDADVADAQDAHAPDADVADADVTDADVTDADVTDADVADVAPPEVVIDADGNEYGTVRIGDQVWMTENLKTTRFNDGTPIALWTFGDNWFEGGGTVPMYQWADTADLNNLWAEDLPFDFHGALYNEAALASGRLAPPGWRIPTRADFEELAEFVAGDGHAGAVAMALKSAEGWVALAGNGTDAYGFRALPNGYVSGFGQATGAQVIAAFATTDGDAGLMTRTVVNLDGSDDLLFFDNSIRLGAGVRLVRDE